MDIYIMKRNQLQATQAECDGYFEHPHTGKQIFIVKGDYLVYLELIEDYIVVPKLRFESLCRRSVINDVDEESLNYYYGQTIETVEDWSSMRKNYEEDVS